MSAADDNIPLEKDALGDLAFQARLLSSVHDAIVAANENYMITYWNASAEKMFGWKAEEVIGEPTADIFQMIVPNSSREEVIEKMMEYGFYEGEVIYHHKDGHGVYTHVHASAIRNHNGDFEGTISSFRDISDRKKAEDALKESENRYRTVFENAGEGIVYADSEGVYLYANQAFADMLGYAPNEIPGKSNADFSFADGQPCCPQIPRTLNKGDASGGECRFRRKDGSELWTSFNGVPFSNAAGEPIANIAMYTDITQRKKAEDALYKSEERLHSLVYSMPDEVWFADTSKTVTIVNPTVIREFGQPSYGESIEHIASTLQVLRPDGSPRSVEEAPLLRALNNEVMRNLEEFIRIPASGELRYRQVNAAPVKDINGDIIGSVAVVRDITEKKKVENALIAERKRFFEMLETLPVMVCLMTSDYHVVFANRTFRDKFGESGGRRCHEYCWGYSEPCPFCESFIPLKTGEPHHWECIDPKGDMHIDAYDFPFTDSDGSTLILEMDIDITERRRAEKALGVQFGRIQAIMESLPVGVWVADADGKLSMANKAAATMYGGGAPSIADLEGFSVYKVYRPDTGERIPVEQHPIARALKGEIVREMVMDFVRFDGSRGVQIASAEPIYGADRNIIGSVAIGMDITTLKKAEEALRESEERYRAVVQNTSAIVLRIDPQGVIRFANTRALEFFGYAEDEFVGQHTLGTFVPERETAGRDLADMVEEVLADPDRFHSNANENMRKSGERIWMEWTNSGIYDTEGHLKEILSVGFDATERKRAEEALRESEKKALALVGELEDADRNKNQFIGVLSHELRNPLAAISTGIQILDATQNIHQATKVKGIISRQTSHLCKLVDDLLELTRISQNKIRLRKENINLNAIVEDATEDIGPEYEKKGIELITDIPVTPVLLGADPVRVAQITGNLLINALKFTPTGGTVWLKLSAEGNDAVIRVKDNGMGISPEILPHLFAPFTQADNDTLDRSHSGLGLGLSIVKGMVELHGGDVTAFSDGLGKGSTFTIRLPITSVEGFPLKTTAAGNDAKGNLTLLIIEDNRDFADLLNTMLSSIGHSVFIACDGMDGERQARQIKPDVILCDVGLPGMSGYDVANRIRSNEELKDVYLVALTGYVGDDDIIRAKEAGFDKHLAKPIDIAALKRLLDSRGDSARTRV